MKNAERIIREIAFNNDLRLKISQEHYNYCSNLKQPLKQKEDAFYYPKRLFKNNVGTYNYAAFFKVGE